MAEADMTEHKAERTIPFYPVHVFTEGLVVLGIVICGGVVGVLGMIMPVGAGNPADPMNTPLHIKPEWYFLALYQILKFVPKSAGAMLPILGLGVVALWPFIDRKADSLRARRMRMVFAAALVIVLIALTIWGEMS